MGKWLKRIKEGSKEAGKKADELAQKIPTESHDHNKRINPKNKKKVESPYGSDDDYVEGDYDDENTNENEVGIQQSQKPESFHHYILENQYKDLEKSIRGYKDVYDKDTREWKVKRKKEHCFTDEEAEEILRTAQSHLATDIKLSWIRKDSFGDYMDTLYQDLAFLFESIAEYRYGRYNKFSKDGKLIEVDDKKQYEMKLQNQKIFLELFTRVQANYSRAIEGSENKATHGSVKGQESLNSTDRDYTGKNRSYT